LIYPKEIWFESIEKVRKPLLIENCCGCQKKYPYYFDNHALIGKLHQKYAGRNAIFENQEISKEQEQRMIKSSPSTLLASGSFLVPG